MSTVASARLSAADSSLRPGSAPELPYRTILLLGLGSFALGTDGFVVAGLIHKLAVTFHVSFSAGAQLITAFALASGVLAPVFAVATARWPVRRTLLIGLAVFAAGNVATAVSGSLALAIIGRAVAGAGAASFAPLASTAGVSLSAPEHRARALAVVIGGSSVATATGAPLGTFIAGAAGWRAAIWFVVLLAVISWIGLAFGLPNIHLPRPSDLRSRLGPLANPRVCTSLMSSFCLLLAVYLVYTYIGVAYGRALHGSSDRLALLLLVFGIAGVISNLFSGRFTDRYGSRVVLNTYLAVAAIDFAIMPWTSAIFTTALVAIGVWAVCSWGQIVPQQYRLVVETPPEHAGFALALSTTVSNGSIAASGLLGAVLIPLVGARHLAWVSTALILAALVTAEVFVALGRKHLGKPSEVSPDGRRAPQPDAVK